MRRTCGFTLIELLVALTIIGLIATLASGSIRLGLRGNERLLEKADASETARVLQGQLRQWLEAAEPVVVDERDQAPVPFLGAAGTMEFSAEMSGRDGIGGLWRVRLSATDGALVMERRRILDETLGPEIDRTVLAPRLSGVRFAYSDGRAWRDDWKEASRLPRKIRLSLQSAEEGTSPIELIVAPAVTRGPR